MDRNTSQIRQSRANHQLIHPRFMKGEDRLNGLFQWLIILGIMVWVTPSFADNYVPVGTGDWPGTTSKLTVTVPSGLTVQASSVYNGAPSLANHSIASGPVLGKPSNRTVAPGIITYTFSPAVPAKEIGFFLIELAFPKGTISIAGGATLADFKVDQWKSPPYTHMTILRGNWAANQSGGTRTGDSSAFWVGSGTKLVSKITITFLGDQSTDGWFAGVAYRKCASNSECPSALPLCQLTSGTCVKPFTSGGHTSNWIFGNSCVMSWDASGKLSTSNKPPAPFNTGEGCSVYSDPLSGQLILYSDGRNVWNAKGQQINSTSLNGNSSAINSALIVTAPGEPGRYIIFSGYTGVGAMYHTKFDMRTSPGKQLASPVKIAATLRYGEAQAITQRKDGLGYWHVAGYLNKMYVTPVTKTGVGTTVVTTLGGNYVSDAHGPLGFSHDGRRLMTSRGFLSSNPPLVMYDFDTETGKISNEKNIGLVPGSRIYGIEFSPDNTKVYLSNYTGGIYQFDLSNASYTRTKLSSLTAGHLRLALDGKIYIAGRATADLHIINDPNKAGTACNFKGRALKIAGCTPSFSLPSIISPQQLLSAASCGNGSLDPGETCDDGNQDNDDGCSNKCKVESGFNCTNIGSVQIVNGGFEFGKAGRFNPNSLSIPGWVIGGQQVDIFPFGTTGVWTTFTTPEGTQNVDLDGAGKTTGFIYQDIKTVQGATYTIQFRVAANCHADGTNPSCSTVLRQAEVSVANGTATPFKKQTITTNVQGIGTSGVNVGKNWPTVSFTFTAQSTSTRLKFASLSSGKTYAGYSVMLDDIKGLATTCTRKPYTCPATGSAKATDLVYMSKTSVSASSSIFPCNLFEVEQKTNKITLIGQFQNNGSAIFVDGLAMDKLGQLFGFSYNPATGKSQLVLIDKKNAATTNIGAELGFLVNGAAFNEKGELWVSTINSSAKDLMNFTRSTLSLAQINPKTGAVVTVPVAFTLKGVSYLSSPRGVDISFTASGALVMVQGNDLYRVGSLSKPELTLIRTYTADALLGITFGPDSCEGHGIDGQNTDDLRILNLGSTLFTKAGTFPGTNAGGGDAARAPVFCGGICFDNDNDGILDFADKDSDNDGIPDAKEFGGTDYSLDSNNNGIPDYKDATKVTCTDTTPKDGICDKLPTSVDTDSDGIPNHFDLDSDNDGIPDIIEAGGTDTNNDGKVDNFIDINKDGLHDPLATTPLPILNSDTDNTPDFLDIDSDNDSLTDTVEAGGVDANNDGRIDGFTDANNDGLHDPVTTNPLPLPDSDGDKKPNYRDTCADARKTTGEGCDDGNDKAGDGCSATCTVETGYTCTGGSTTAQSVCTKDNVAPVITGTPGTTAPEDVTYSYKPGVTDPDAGQKHTWRGVKLPQGATINTSTGEVTWTPTNAQAGQSYDFEIEVCDDGNPKKCSKQTWKVNATNVNDPPTITNNPGTEVLKGQTYSYKPNVVDIDAGDTHTYTLKKAPPGAKVDPQTGEVTWTPTPADAGKKFDFELEVCDKANACVTKKWTVEVTTVSGPPTITSTPPTEVYTNQPYVYDAKATDPNPNDKLSWKLIKGPAGAKIDPQTGQLTWTPGTGDAGKDADFEIEVCDDGTPPKCAKQSFQVKPQTRCNVDLDCASDMICSKGSGAVYICIPPGCAKTNPKCASTDDFCKDSICQKDPCKQKQCAAGEICRPSDGKCIKPCANVQCQADEKCVDGACVSTKCDTATCQTGEVCNQQSGKPVCVKDPCSAQACRHGRACTEGHCIDDPCATMTCPTQQRCLAGQCVDELPCTVDSDCPNDKVCLKGKCAVPNCYVQAATCPQGELCVEAVCNKDDCANKNCAKDEFCRPSDNKCVKACAGVKCPANEMCVDGACVANPCASVQCSSGQVCVAGTCVKERCKESNACRHGRLCQAEKNACVDDLCKGVTCPDTIHVCKHGQCVPKAECMFDDDCKGSDLCVKEKCITPTCGSKTPCTGDKVCVDGACIDDSCKGKTCTDGQFCKAGVCVDSCASVTCQAGTICQEGKCVSDPCDGKQCAAGETCNNGTCVKDRCRTDACRDGRLCKVDRCEDDPCNGIKCPTDLTCKDGQCTGTKTCEVDSDCPGELICLDKKCADPGCYKTPCPADKLCLKGKCVDKPCDGVTCSKNEVCRPSDGKCVTICPDCPTGQVCVNGACVDDKCKDKKCNAGEKCIDGDCKPDPCDGQGKTLCRYQRSCQPEQDKRSCTDDPCTGVTCPNGGACKEGVCHGGRIEDEKIETEKIEVEKVEVEATTEAVTKDGGANTDDDGSDSAFAAGGCRCSADGSTGPFGLVFLTLLFLLIFQRRKS